MIIRTLLLTGCLPLALLAAEGGPAADDPFGAYERDIKNQLSAILEHDQAPVRETVHESADNDQNTTASDSKADEIRTFARRFWGGRENQLAAAIDRLRKLRPTLEPILEQEGVPRQLIAVVLIESGARPLAVSPRQARGLWQFVPETARQYGLSVSEVRDERIYVEAATRAAARYLRDLHSHFGDWPLALAAYNAGEASVESALQRGAGSTFWRLSAAGLLPQETRNYVPAVLRAMQLLGYEQPAIAIDNESQQAHWLYASSGVAN